MRLSYKLVGSFKGVLFILAVAIVLAVILYTDGIVSDLRENSRRLLTLQVERFQLLFTQGALEKYLSEVQTKDFPLIVADSTREPISWSGLPELEELPFEKAQKIAKRHQREWFNQGNEPIEIVEDSLVFYYYYGDSALIKRLRFLPWIEVAVVGGLILIGYFGFVNIKKSEERSVWVGMARETAHQLGTPLTSMLGWIELLSEKPNDTNIQREIRRDIDRLKTVTERFNQIGSHASLTSCSVEPIIRDAVAYIGGRLPQLSSGEVKISVDYSDESQASVNPTLFAWVIENLLKNAVESMQGRGGEVKLQVGRFGKALVIDVADSGLGISRSEWRNVFRPGYTTKSRGWGLGLSLSRRIIEDIHLGRIFILESKARKGTVIRLQLPV